MKNPLIKLCLVALFAFVTFSCNNDDDNNGSVVAVSTPEPEVVAPDQGTVMVNFKAEISQSNSTLYKVGVCWSESPNPTVAGSYTETQYVQLGVYTFDVVNQLVPGKTYYIKAYAKDYDDTKPVVYGAEVTYTHQLTAEDFTLDYIAGTPGTLVFRALNTTGLTFSGGYRLAYSTTANPDENSDYVAINDDLQGSQLTAITGLQPNTVYYVRVVAFFGTVPLYSDELEVRTTGYTGPGGGIVALDRGPDAEGYRYVEIYSQGLTYETTGQLGAHWGIPAQAVNGLSATQGSGPANTQAIVNAVSSANCAAKLCNDFVSNGVDDWFLPSSDELYAINRALVEMDVILTGRVWTSVAYGDILTTNAALSMIIDTNGESNFELFDIDQTASVYAVRRYN